MAIPKRDCPHCRRKNVEGTVYYDKDDNIGRGVIAGLGGAIGTCVGPIGTAVGVGLGKKLGDQVCKRKASDGTVLYIFKCPDPDCRHEWKEWVHE